VDIPRWDPSKRWFRRMIRKMKTLIRRRSETDPKLEDSANQ